MILHKAIEITESLLDGTYDHRDEAMEAALKLLIKAAKAWEFMRTHSGMSFDYYLPGETED